MAIRNVEIISKEMIKPLTPTPTHLKTLKLSLLDQLAIPVYVPLIFFYPHHQLTIINPQQICALLKQSLSKILTLFYPLSGLVLQNSRVECNDSGAEFIESRVDARLSDVVQEANVDELKKLLPLIEDEQNQVVLKVGVNFFECGGVAIAVCLWHKLCDGTALVAFIEAWAATCRGGETKFRHPSFDFASVFPPLPPSETLDFIQGTGVTKDKIVTKRLVFNKEKIEKLKEQFNGGSCTRVEAVSSYIWGRFIEAAGSKTSSFAASHAVNLRPRKKPPISQHMFGNCWRPAVALSDDNLQLAAKLREAIASVDDDFIKKVENGEYMNDLKRTVDLFSKGGVEFCHFSSWCRFPLYEVDFGWGKPVRVCTTSLPIKNIVILMGTPCGQGIEAWVNIVEDDLMQVFV